MVLERMKEIAENYLKREVTDAVITVPAYFNNAQRQATVDAGRIAGLTVKRIINEPTAAALAYAHKNHEFIKEGTNILVFDLGGGTFDVTILRVERDIISVLATNGDTHLGGGDFDTRLVNHCVEHFERNKGVNLKCNARAMHRLRAACEAAKERLSTNSHTRITVDSIHENIGFSMEIPVKRFHGLIEDLLQQTLVPVQNALDDANVRKSQIHKIIMVGGSTRIPRMQVILKQFFDGKELEMQFDIKADQAVAYGAAIQAAALISDTPHDVLGRRFRDVTPLSLGTDIVSPRSMNEIIPRNTPIPVNITKEYSTIRDNQESVVVEIRQGEHHKAKMNFLLGKFELAGIPLAPKGEPTIDITFGMNVDGIFTATARDRATGNTNGITIENVSGRMKKEQIEQLIKDADNYRHVKEELVKARGAADELERECNGIKRKFEHVYTGSRREKSKMMKMCDDTLVWLADNEIAATKCVYEERRNEINVAVNQFLASKKDGSCAQ